MPASETVDFEREFADIVRELRAIPSEAPPELRERVRALGEPTPRRRPRMSRRALLVLAPACVVAIAAGGLLYSVFTPSTIHHESFRRLPGGSPTSTVQAEQRGVKGLAPTQAVP